MNTFDKVYHQKQTTWFSRFSNRAKSIMKQKNNDSNYYNKALPSPPSSYITSNDDDGDGDGDDDDDDDDEYNENNFTLSPSNSISSFSTIRSSSSTSSKMDPFLKSKLPPSPTLSACDKTKNNNKLNDSIHHYTDYFHDRPLPTQRRFPGRYRQSISSIDNENNGEIREKTENEVALNQLAKDTLLYLVESSSLSSSSSANLQDKLIDKLQTDSSSTIHPSVFNLAQETLAYFNQVAPLSPECQKLKSKLNVCVMLHDAKKIAI
ncbi:hypothetical protein BJ944DRAFT_253304 [Cunninghamella echinulata]|nr:hypothetical protein BJ944DRAFT_253304 [Cunninghamella echinulata]